MPESSHDVIVIGAGVAGLTAAGACRREGLSTAILEPSMFGGLVLNVNELDGDIAGSGADVAAGLMMEALDLGADNLAERAVALREDGRGFILATDTAERRAKAVIIASGARLRQLGIPGEERFHGRGVSHCADCDGPMFQGREVTVVGGGDSALQSALVLAGFCRRVHLLHRGERFTAAPHFVRRVMDCSNIAIRWRTRAAEVLGETAVDAVRIAGAEAADGAAATLIRCSGFFAFIGLESVCDFAPALERDGRGCLIASGALQTSLPGVFAAGAVRAGNGGMLADAKADGAAAARAAARWVHR
ncbi:MAG: FAD-dependent oxidoreductase [Betaproteobacteria bacterium]|nr:FAD-dependent oxidoreductase [Betaproteobacteria bacterium]